MTQELQSVAQHDGKVTYADADKVEVRREDGALITTISKNSVKSNSVVRLTTNVPFVKLAKGDFIADGPSMERVKPTVAMTWK